MRQPSVLIAGYGIVGANLHNTFRWADLYDPPKNLLQVRDRYDFIFVAVPTPRVDKGFDTGRCDTSFVKKVMKTIKEKDFLSESGVVILKSTVPPGYTTHLIAEMNLPIIFSPEYQGETHHANNVDYPFVILGGEKDYTKKAAQLYQYVCTGTLRVMQTTSITAELCKYMENCFLATKVTFCNEFYRVAQRLGVDYSELRELFVADPRVNPSHTFVYDEAPYYESKCLDKDIPAIISYTDRIGPPMPFMKAVRAINAKNKKTHQMSRE